MKRRFNQNRPPDSKASRSARSRGVALIAVLWLAILLAVIAGSLLTTTRSELRLARNLLDSARADALAEGGIHLAIPFLLDRDAGTRWAADGTVHVVELESGRLEIAVQDAAGRIDLNAAPPELLAGLFRAAGANPDDAAILAARIADWRDRDEDASADGAEQAEYDAAGLAVRVGNAPFLTPGEILRIPGIDMALYGRIEGAVTVWSRQRGVDPSAAPRLALLALPGMSESAADALIAARAEAEPDPRGTHLLPFIPAEAQRWLARGGGRIAYVTAQAQTREGGIFRREAVIELRPGADPPYLTHAWRPALAVSTE
ncbi:MAG: type II secretion system protein GspK [Alphaproteobacteria bacterium]|nr:type II secretion system protein GspK [Alphaproteobacteria bacterium]